MIFEVTWTGKFAKKKYVDGMSIFDLSLVLKDYFMARKCLLSTIKRKRFL